ncbi:MAG: YggS family pyridoxal phosphate-dependent enzyme [Oscillospiraceae bacterium]|nr:YggS family pyridoxal phosphate-dependent enzyme [Oscillospiraceae bacterium]
MCISDNVSRLREAIDTAARQSGRLGSDVALVAATKTQPTELVQAAIAAGVDACGENRVQELLEKSEAGAYVGAPLHFIGHLQKNKIKKVVGTVDLIQSVDSPALLAAIDGEAARRGIIQDTLIQVNVGNDSAKFGIDPYALDEFLGQVASFSHIRVRGLMTMLPFSLPITENRRLFAKMYQLFVDIRDNSYDNIGMDFLSMGMSGDFRAAVSEGANMIRVGSTIFGDRV